MKCSTYILHSKTQASRAPKQLKSQSGETTKSKMLVCRALAWSLKFMQTRKGDVSINFSWDILLLFRRGPLNNSICGVRTCTNLSVHRLDMPSAQMTELIKNTQSLGNAESPIELQVMKLITWAVGVLGQEDTHYKSSASTQVLRSSLSQSASLFYTFNKIYFFRGKLFTGFILETTDYKEV